jgi:MFS family permease
LAAPVTSRLTQNPDFLKLWGAQSISVLGSAITNLALPTAAILTLHANPFEVGVLAALQRLPFLFLSLPAGAWLDRVNRKPVMIVCDLARAAVLASIPVAAMFNDLGLGQLFVAAFLIGVFTVFFDVAYLAYLPALVSRQDLMGGNQRLQMTLSISNLVGPGLAGILIQWIGAARAIAANSVSFLLSAVLLVLIRAEARIEPAASPTKLKDEIAEGLRWVFHNPLLRSQLIGLTLAGFGLFMALAVILIYIYDNLHLTPGVVGGVFVIEGVAGVAGLMAAPRIVKRLTLGTTMWVSQIGLSLGVIAIPLAGLGQPVILLALAVMVIGFADSVQDLNQVTIRQSLTPDRLQGRMNATFRLFFWGSWPVASFTGGALATWIGAAPTIVVGGGLSLAMAIFIALSPLGRLRERATSELIVESGPR